MNRPKTASIISIGTNSRSGNNNSHNLQDEPHQRQRFESHLRPKKNKPTPWQKSLEDPMVTLVVSPGYILSKNKSKYDAVIKTDEFFNPVREEIVKKKTENTERDVLLEQLQQQIADLTLYLQEERYTHRQSKQKAEDFLRDKVDELQVQHKNEIREQEEQHSNQMKMLESNHREQFEGYKKVMEAQIARMKEDNDFIQSAFTSYRATIHDEMNAKWVQTEQAFKEEFQAKKKQEVDMIRERFNKEKDLEMGIMLKDHRKELDDMKKQHGKEIEDLSLYYADMTEKAKKMKVLTQEFENLKDEHEDLKTVYSELEKHCAGVSKELINTRGRLQAHEENFDRKVDEVDDRYKQKVNNLLLENAELRKSFRKKCEELAVERYKLDETHQADIDKLRDKMENRIQRKKESGSAAAATENVGVLQDQKTSTRLAPNEEDISTTH